MIELGKFNKLKVKRKVDFGLYLDGGEEGKILLPTRYVPEGTKIGDTLNVFLYLDQEERLIATTQTPLAQVGEFAILKVNWVNEFGAFLDWGLMKDLFCPFREQKKKMQIGEEHLVYVLLDEQSYRLMASERIERYLNNDDYTLFATQLLQYLQDHDGQCPLGDKSPVLDIYNTFRVSKKVFKKAVGDLYKKHLIIITDKSIQLA